MADPTWRAPKTDWDKNPKEIEPADINRIEGNILYLYEKVFA